MSLILVDASALMYRSYYAFVNRPLVGPTGELTSVVFGFLGGVLRLIQAYEPAYLAVVYDVKGTNFRHEIAPSYKGTRKPMPADLAEQVPRLREVLEGWGLARLEVPGFEADDVIATVARRSAGVAGRVWLFTGDKDFLQILDDRVGLLKPGRRGDEVTPVTAADVRREYGLEPPRLRDVFALSGDVSDNIPGCPGIGEKTAAKLIRDFGSLDDLLANLADPRLTPRLRRLLEEHREQILLSRRLFALREDVPLEIDWQALETCLPVGDEVTRLLRKLGLMSMLDLIEKLRPLFAPGAAIPPVDSPGAGGPDPARPASPEAAAAAGAAAVAEELAEEVADELASGAAPATPPEAAPAPLAADAASRELSRRGYVICNTAAQLRAYLEKIPEGAPLALDAATDGLRQDASRLVGISLAAEGSPVAFVPVLRREPGPEGTGGEAAGPAGAAAAGGAAADLFGPAAGASRDRSVLEALRPLLGPLLADPGRLKIGHNLKFDEWILARGGLPLEGPRFDTMVAAWLLDPGQQRYSLAELAEEHLQERVTPYESLFLRSDRIRDILEVPPARLALQAAEGADVAFRLHRRLESELEAAGLGDLFRDLEMPLSRVLFRMERRGIRIDVPFLRELRQRFAAEMEVLEGRVREAAGCSFNLQSPRQLAEVLFDRLGLKPLKRTATGWSTDVEVLSQLAEGHPLPALILEHRQLAKLQSTYVEALGQLVDPRTGLVHTCFNQAVAATGRLSSSDPNLQNIPVRTELGRLIRRAFVPRRPGNLLLSADYSQIELRLLAHLSGDGALRRAFLEGADVHRRTGALLAGVPEEEVCSDLRRNAKTINFGVIYGMGARALAKQIGVPVPEAKKFIDAYFETYPGVREFIERTKEQARRTGSVQTLLGRRRLLPEILSQNNRIRSFQERAAVNTPIQGTAADLIKLAMTRLDAELARRGLQSLLLLQVHDELVLEVPEGELEEVRELVRREMESVLQAEVPLVVDLHVGRDWAEAHG